MIRPDRVYQIFLDEDCLAGTCLICEQERRQKMNAGMLWFDNDPKIALTAKIERAVDYYRHKYGRDPNLCLIHPSMLPSDGKSENEKPQNGKITVRPYRPVLPGHLWIGIEEKR